MKLVTARTKISKKNFRCICDVINDNKFHSINIKEDKNEEKG